MAKLQAPIYSMPEQLQDALNEQKLADCDLEYMNRLSDYLFILGRYANVLDGYTEKKSKVRDKNRING